jgi:serine phosphatase RsbU (regulator of sigma subunit)
MFGRSRLEAILHSAHREPAPAVLDRVFDALVRHTGDAPPEDDQTLVVVKNG